MFECTSCVVWRVDIDALNLASKFLFEGFEREEVVAENKLVIEKVVVGQPMLGVVRILRVLQQDTRLQLGRFALPIQVSSSRVFCLLICRFGLEARVYRKTRRCVSWRR